MVRYGNLAILYAISASAASLPTSIPWQSCYEDLATSLNANISCANLTVPLDYLNASNPKTTYIGIARVRSNKVRTPREALFVNRGGPGASTIHPELSELKANVSDSWNFMQGTQDLILVDPRGIGHSRELTCGFTKDSYNTKTKEAHSTVPDYNFTSTGTLHSLLSSDKGVVDTCRDHEDIEYLAHINTPPMVRDIDLVRNLTGYEQINFWGLSYGTYVGSVYASMFPDRVGKFILDGVIDITKFGGFVPAFFRDAHKQIVPVMRTVGQQCVDAAKINPYYCPLGNASIAFANGTAADVTAVFLDTINTLAVGPVAALGGKNFTFSDLLDQTRTALKEPAKLRTLTDLILSLSLGISLGNVNVTDSFPPNNPTSAPIRGRQEETRSNASVTDTTGIWPRPKDVSDLELPAVICVDGTLSPNATTVESYTNVVREYLETDLVSGYFATSSSTCLSWPNVTSYNPERHSGVFNKTQLKTKMMIIAITGDAITDYYSAQNAYNAIGANNAVWLVHDGVGHCSGASPSHCTQQAISTYLVNGTLPSNDTVCKANDNNLFVFYSIAEAQAAGYSNVSLYFQDRQVNLTQLLERGSS